jgi:outer membrane protein OmpA-like peptidoglycan-associated protein
MRASVTRILVGAAAVALVASAPSGCAETARLKGGIESAQSRVEQVERNGAYTCAPKELALAKSNLKFATLEIAEGLSSRARQHYDVAMDNLQRAEANTPPEKCAGLAVVVAAPLPPECVDADNDRICADTDRCPDQAEDLDGFEDTDGCPEDQDTDGDGIMDSIDQCVLDVEDRDSYLDEDGCPDNDNDADSIVDGKDKCPDDPEDPDGFEDEDGCPDKDNDADEVLDPDDECPNVKGDKAAKGCPKKYDGVEITETHIRINQQIHFAYNKAKILKDSFPILATVSQVLRDNPEITLSIEGHTDSRGNDAYNKKLSTKRAKAVLDHLIKIGKIDKGRLTSQGWGEQKPIDTNLTDEGRAANRRVEFVRTDVPQSE